ncbi:MAG: peroxiredoxin [Chloroflexi bacterium]|jgi:peroxiredoxin Q/BCP|nr:MAG: alkyl hydroperoxide reductase [Chloroflexi bacterium OLB13]MBC6957076.1 peroxiredoxin [Chloroflexota bacterium]MBV6437696.1 putative peroxiredoxin [Anaerolineae bacterium]MDL1916047.1 peroxiredoxin [Anaerolineae bacterium CFX4]OQY85035.1 MAG: peroxiredoxin [Anaerolineae bacterium UTCFX5]
MPAKGQPMPEFELPNQDGKIIKLSDLRGKRVVLFAFPKANTSGCTTQACGFRDRFANILTKNATVLGISADPQKDLKKWKDQEGLQYDLLSDLDHAYLDALGVWQEKSMYGKTYWGIVRSHWVIDENGNVLDEQIKISPDESVKQAYDLLG